ncbi:hypothetical protein Rumeso_03503 [Rubellimicrobium mesophilum DSM 19309]|uniref:Uncharacterized protein n=1 Tax=Rubellimicrobium mesophilum DSM 19309 TaxID=442562 RepID=A0A017HKC2_9RHOB|nr:hypothetical protein Rumeso_03503 [Rubellimicrobium mesophilum DSM 19309]
MPAHCDPEPSGQALLSAEAEKAAGADMHDLALKGRPAQ